ncbi:MAG: transglycosylase domain-containing protein, partial [Bacteroidota bacterium]
MAEGKPPTYSSGTMERYFKDPKFRHAMLKRKPDFFRSHRRTILLSGILFLGLMTYYAWYVVDGLPPLDKLENPKPELSTQIISIDGEVVDQFFVKNRTRVSLDQLPPGLIAALISTEDKAFYDHWGVHLRRLFTAMIKNVLAFDLTREGASTITQQLARNLYLKPDRNIFDKITRKLREQITAIQIERNFTKKEILELYLNVTHFGRSAYGIESAAQLYFNKKAAELTTPEYTLLVGMLKGGNYYDPIRFPHRAFPRRDIVLGQMVRDGILSSAEVERVREDTLQFKLPDPDLRSGIAPHFVEWVRQQLVRKAEQYGFDIYRDGLKVYTTLDAAMQRHANRAVEEHFEYFQPRFDSLWNWTINEQILIDNIEKTIRERDDYKRALTEEVRDSIANVL